MQIFIFFFNNVIMKKYIFLYGNTQKPSDSFCIFKEGHIPAAVNNLRMDMKSDTGRKKQGICGYTKGKEFVCPQTGIT